MRKFRFMAVLLVLALLLPGCHGKVEKVAFQVPDSFDTSRQYEITLTDEGEYFSAKVGDLIIGSVGVDHAAFFADRSCDGDLHVTALGYRDVKECHADDSATLVNSRHAGYLSV